MTNYLFGGTKNSHVGKMLSRSEDSLVESSLEASVDKLMITSLYCCFEWSVRVALVFETKPRENDRATDKRQMLFWIYSQ